jgi:predicted restriction endonuclease
MNLKNIKPESVYRVKYGGANFVIVDQIFIYEDNNKKSFVLQNDKFRKRLYTGKDHKEILSEKEGFYDWQENQEMVLKIVCCRYPIHSKYIIFNAADSYDGEVLTQKEIFGDDINSEEMRDRYRPLAPRSLYFEK